MKKLFVLAVVSIASASAFASKARVAALQNAAHLSDTTEIVGSATRLAKPDTVMNFGEFARMEWGSTAGATSNAEGGFVRKMGESSALGFYLGKKSDTFATFLTAADPTATLLLRQQNPWAISYGSKMGDLNWGVGFNYSNSDMKGSALKQKENVMGLNLSATSAAGWDAQFGMGLGAEAKNELSGSERSLKASSAMGLSGGYKMGTNYFNASYLTAAAKHTTGTAATVANDYAMTSMSLGWTNTHQKDGADVFYGVSYNTTTFDDKNISGGAGKTDTTTFPVIVGVEAEAASWLILRGSVTQNVLLGSRKVGTADANTTADNTTVAAGAGLKWNKFLLDGTFANAGANGGALGTDTNFITKVGMTYSW